MVALIKANRTTEDTCLPQAGESDTEKKAFSVRFPRFFW
jgi:hypothetical protein